MNIANNYNQNPDQDEMRNASFNPNIYNLYYPFIPLDEKFRQISHYIPEVRDYYWVSNYGRVYNANNGYLVMWNQNSAGYLIYNLMRKQEYVDAGKGKYYTVAGQILVCTCFVSPKPEPNYQVNHKDFRRSNNYYENLEWMTPQANLNYSRLAGNYWTGNVYSSARYSEEQVRHICVLLQSGITDPKVICQRVFNCEPTPGLYSLIRQIKSGKNWSQVSKDYSGIADVEHRNFTPDWVIHGMCAYMRDNPDKAYTAPLDEVLSSFGIDGNSIGFDLHERYRSALRQLRYKNAYRRIADQYGIPRQ